MPVTHILLSKFKPSTTREVIERISKQIIAFKDNCRDKDGKPYVLATKGGINNSPDDTNKGMTHGFIIEFKNEVDRKYFLEEDKAHKDFVAAVAPTTDDFLTLDFTEGIY
ncbi:hypothetical protein GGR51DRAFT_557220 [Nemania sp. FL0031]|nr:hypothetical protein GGR51DRAFT_557220 [Nemania sp. FL0031]